jgi:hypothetical protein
MAEGWSGCSRIKSKRFSVSVNAGRKKTERNRRLKTRRDGEGGSPKQERGVCNDLSIKSGDSIDRVKLDQGWGRTDKRTQADNKPTVFVKRHQSRTSAIGRGRVVQEELFGTASASQPS